MKAVILAGGLGTRISEESSIRPKPMIEIGHKPILWHIMKIFSASGINEFVILCGYKSNIIKDFFFNYALYNSDFTLDVVNHSVEIHKNGAENWKITLLETGLDTMTGGRIKRVKEFTGNERFCMTYGDGVTDLDIKKLIAFHKKHGKLATVTAVLPPGRFGSLNFSGDSKTITSFQEKPSGDGAWINGGFFILEPGALDYIAGDETVWEQEPLQKLAKDGQLMAYKHDGFWHSMDSLRDKNNLEKIWKTGNAPWKVWK